LIHISCFSIYKFLLHQYKYTNPIHLHMVNNNYSIHMCNKQFHYHGIVSFNFQILHKVEVYILNHKNKESKFENYNIDY
jgi:predicted RNA binding protein with dsRBD fold (UPF0201 family)